MFVTNALRALREVAPENDLRKIPNIVLVGGSARDFEIPEMLMEEFSNYRIVCGRGNIRRTEGPRKPWRRDWCCLIWERKTDKTLNIEVINYRNY